MLEEETSLLLKQQKSYKQDAQNNKNNRKKHNRRTAKEINRQYICPYKNCQKVYGSEGSLNLHIKIKHNGGNKTDREKLAKTIIMAHIKGHLCQVIDQIDLNLPPGTISKAAKKFGLTGQVEHQVLQQIYQRLQNKQENALERIKAIHGNEEGSQNKEGSGQANADMKKVRAAADLDMQDASDARAEDGEPLRLLMDDEHPRSLFANDKDIDDELRQAAI